MELPGENRVGFYIIKTRPIVNKYTLEAIT